MVGQYESPQSLAYKPLNQIASLRALEIAIYSASIVEHARIDYKVALQLTTQPPMVKT